MPRIASPISFDNLRRLRDIAGQLGARDLCSALQELIHLRAARANTNLPGWVGSDACITPEDLKP